VNKTLEEAKERLARLYLGTAAIHGVGIRRADDAVYLYVDRGSAAQTAALLDEIASHAAPFKVVVVEEEPPTV
jgi:hypothetical protein